MLPYLFQPHENVQQANNTENSNAAKLENQLKKDNL